MLGKLGWFDQSYHLPLIVAGLGVPRDARVDAGTGAVDLMPTLLDWLRIRGGWPDPRQPPFGLGVNEVAMCAMRTGDWKCVHFTALPPMLYAL